MSDNQDKKIVLKNASHFNINFPKENDLINESDAKKARNAIQKRGAVDSDGTCYIEKSALPTMLCTDTKGANRVYINAPEKDKYKDGNNLYLTVSAVNKEISDRIQQPKEADVHERLKYTEQCLQEFRDNSEIALTRHVREAQIQKGLRNLKGRKIKAASISSCEYSGQPLDVNAAAHHRVRKADDPSKALDLDNIDVINPEVHEKIHALIDESPEMIEELFKNEGWKLP